MIHIAPLLIPLLTKYVVRFVMSHNMLLVGLNSLISILQFIIPIIAKLLVLLFRIVRWIVRVFHKIYKVISVLGNKNITYPKKTIIHKRKEHKPRSRTPRPHQSYYIVNDYGRYRRIG